MKKNKCFECGKYVFENHIAMRLNGKTLHIGCYKKSILS